MKALAASESPLYTRGSPLLVENGANVNLVDNSQNSPLFYASEKGYTEIVEILLLAGAE